MDVKILRLDLSKKPCRMQIVTVGRGDVEGTEIRAYVYENGVNVNTANLPYMYLRIRFSDGSTRSFAPKSKGSLGDGYGAVYRFNARTFPVGETDIAYVESSSTSGGEMVSRISTERFRLRVVEGKS